MGCENADPSGKRGRTPMNDIRDIEARLLGERIDLLETRLTFQDETIDALNKTITEQWLKIDVLTRQLKSIQRTAAGSRDPHAGLCRRTAAALLARDDASFAVASAESRSHSGPKRRCFRVAFAVVLGRCGLRGADRIGRWKTVHQAGFKLFVNFAIRQSGFTGVGRVLVVRRRIKLLNHGNTPVVRPNQRFVRREVPRLIHPACAQCIGNISHLALELMAPRHQLTTAADPAEDRLKNNDDNCFSNADAWSVSKPSRAHKSASIGGSSGR